MTASKSPKKAKSRKTKEAGADSKKLSALDAAAKVLAETGQPMSCKELIEAMAAKGYWSSPGGKTPSATLYSGITKEISTKGKESRFQKTARQADEGGIGRTPVTWLEATSPNGRGQMITASMEGRPKLSYCRAASPLVRGRP